MSAPEFIAPPETVLGLLQRGRGEGYRRVLELPRIEAHELLIKCITRDPRLDSQCESRDSYYASIAIETGLPLEPLVEYLRQNNDPEQEPWATSLTVRTLTQLAKANYGNTREILCDYIQWGHEWDDAVHDLVRLTDDDLTERIARAIERRFPSDDELDNALGFWRDRFGNLSRFSSRIDASFSRAPKQAADESVPDLTSLSPAEFLDLANQGNYLRLGKAIAEIVGPSDVDLLVSRVSLQTPFAAHVALAGLRKIAPSSLAEWLSQLLLTIPYRSAQNPANLARVLLRRGIARAILSLPAAATLPIARDWITQEDPKKREIAEDLLEEHATAEDLPILRELLLPMLTSEDDEYGCLVIRAFYNLANVGIIQELVDIFYHFRFSRGRSYAAKAIQITSPEFFAETLAFECLWDCEEGTRELGAQFAPLESSEALSRIRHFAEDSSEEEKVRTAAKARIESISLPQPAG